MANMAMTMADLQQLGRTEDSTALQRTKILDADCGQISAAVYWSCHEVADFIEMLGFPQYRVQLINSLYSILSNIYLGMFSSE
jgi:endonuclease III